MIAGGAAAGVFGSLLGLGGGILIVPLLTLVFGLDLREAVGVSLVSVIMTSSAAAGVYLERHVANLRLGMTPRAVHGDRRARRWLDRVPDRRAVPRVLFALLLATWRFTMAARRGAARGGREPEPPTATRARRRPPAPRRRRTTRRGRGATRSATSGRASSGRPARGSLGAARRRWRHHQGAADAPRDGRAAARRDRDQQPDGRDHGRGERRDLPAPRRDRPVRRGTDRHRRVPRASVGSRVAHRIELRVLRWLFVAVLLYTAVQMLLRAIT